MEKNPGKKPPRKLPPGKLPQKICPQGNCPQDKCPPGEKFYQIFVAFDIILRLFLLKLFKLTSFRNVSRTPATSIVYLLVTVVNGIDYCHKKLLFRCCRDCRFASEFIRLSFSETFINKAHSSASDTVKVKIAKSVLPIIVTHKDIIFNK